MKILFVHDHYFKVGEEGFYSNGGFPSSVWSRYLAIFERLTVVGRDGGDLGPLENSYTLSSAEFVDFSLLPNLSNFKSLIFGNRAALAECRRLVFEHDGVIARLPSRMGQVFLSEAVKQGKPYAVEVVGCAWDGLWNHGTWKGKLIAPFYYYKTKSSVVNARYALYVTKTYLQNRYPCKGEITYSSNVEIPDVDEDVLAQRHRSWQEAKPRKVILGLIGNYAAKYKGIDVAIRALSLANKEIPDWELQVVGAGDPWEYTQLAAALGVGDKVRFMGTLPSGHAIYDWLDSVCLYLQPSLTEGLPRALVEAMSRGCPALGSNVGGIPELLDPTELVTPNDYRSLALKVIELLQDRSALTRLSDRNFRVARSYYRSVLEKRRSDFWRSFKEYILARD